MMALSVTLWQLTNGTIGGLHYCIRIFLVGTCTNLVEDSTKYTAAKTKAYKEPQAKKKTREEAEAAGIVVGAGGNDNITDMEKDETIKINLNKQSKRARGAGCYVTGGLSRFTQSKEDHFGFSDVSTSVDATSAVNRKNRNFVEFCNLRGK